MTAEKVSLSKSERDFLSKLGEFDVERVKKSIRKLSETYGVSWQKILDFLDEKRTAGPSEKEHRFFVAYQIIDEIFDETLAKLLTALEAFGTIGDLPYNAHPPKGTKDYARKKLIQTILREAQGRIKDELPLPKID